MEAATEATPVFIKQAAVQEDIQETAAMQIPAVAALQVPEAEAVVGLTALFPEIFVVVRAAV
jgi:hypothetical protein